MSLKALPKKEIKTKDGRRKAPKLNLDADIELSNQSPERCPKINRLIKIKLLKKMMNQPLK